MPTTMVVDFMCKPGKSGAMREHLRAAMEVMKGLPGNQGATFYQAEGNPDHFLEISVWDSEEAHQALVAKFEADGLLDEVMELLVSMPEMRRFRAL